MSFSQLIWHVGGTFGKTQEYNHIVQNYFINVQVNDLEEHATNIKPIKITQINGPEL